MTDKAVSALTSLTGANTATGDLLYIVDISEAAAADRSKKITAEELQNYLKKFPATIGVGGATPAASGAGISFPATASASSDANTLDDYEEGTFTPTIATSGANITYSIQDGSYTKIGRFVSFGLQINVSTVTSNGSGDFIIGGLPFAFSASNWVRLSTQLSSVDIDATAFDFYAYLSSGTQMKCLYSYDNSSWTVATASNVVLGAGSIIVISGFYFI